MGILVQNSSPEISGCTIRDFTNSGIYAFGDSLPLVFNNSFNGNDTGVQVSANGFGFFRGNTYSGNGSFGLNYLGSRIVDARYSHWGDPSGPYDPSDDTVSGGLYNPAGLGDAVSDYVNYVPWVTSLPSSSDSDIIPDDWELKNFLNTGVVHDE